MIAKSTSLRGVLLCPGTDGRVELVRGCVEVSEGHIRSVDRERSEIGPGSAVGDDELVICPGFVDAHLHLPQFDSIGSEGLTLLDWLNTRIFPAEMRWADARYARGMAGRVAKRLLASGTTCVCAYGTVHHGGTAAAMEALDDAGLRGFVGQVLMDRGGPSELNLPSARLLEEASAQRVVGRISPIVSPRFALSCSMELMRGAATIAREHGWPVQTHYAEMIPECERVREEFGGMDYLDVYDTAGLLGPRTLLAHGVWADDRARKRLAETGTVIAHCPTANLFLGSGLMDRAGMLKRGVCLALGSDVAGGPDVCMVRVARAMAETARARVLMAQPQVDDFSSLVPTASDCWWQITRGNAEALGLSDAGRLEVGCAADLVVLKPGAGAAAFGAWSEQPDPLAGLLYGFDERWIAEVWARGERVV